MSTKSFKNIPKPVRQPTAEEIAGFEATGHAGRKLHPDAAVIAETQKSVSPEILLSGNTEIHKGVDAGTRNDVNTEIRKAGMTDTQKSVDTEIREHGGTENRQSADAEILVRAEPIVRLTVDLPEQAHLRFKAACALSRRTMVQEVRDLIERRTAELEGRETFA